MEKEIYSVKASRFGTPTGTVSMPASMTEMGENVRDSITLEETEPTLVKIRTEQGATPRRVVVSEPGETSITLQYHDMSYDNLAALKGGESIAAVPGTSAAAWKPGMTFESPELGYQVETDSGEYFNFYNARIVATIGGSGSRAGFFYVQVKVYPQVTADKTGSWEIRDVEIPQA